MRGLDEETAALAAANHGRLTRAGLLARGVPEWLIDAWVRRDVLLVDRPGQYRVAGAPESEMQAVLGAVAAASRAVVRRSAAAGASTAVVQGEGASGASTAVVQGDGQSPTAAGWAAVAADETALALAGAEGLALVEPFAIAVG